MSFFSRARAAGAMEYGRARAEKYGRWARLWFAMKVSAGTALVLLVVWAATNHR